MEILYCVHNESNRITFRCYLIAPDFNVCCPGYHFPECVTAFKEPELDKVSMRENISRKSAVLRLYSLSSFSYNDTNNINSNKIIYYYIILYYKII